MPAPGSDMRSSADRRARTTAGGVTAACDDRRNRTNAHAPTAAPVDRDVGGISFGHLHGAVGNTTLGRVLVSSACAAGRFWRRHSDGSTGRNGSSSGVTGLTHSAESTPALFPRLRVSTSPGNINTNIPHHYHHHNHYLHHHRYHPPKDVTRVRRKILILRNPIGTDKSIENLNFSIKVS